MKQTTTQTAYMFFKTNGAYSYDPKTETQDQGRRRCARELAKAEQQAKRKGIKFGWDDDPFGCSGCDCTDPACACSTGKAHETVSCFAYVPANGIETMGAREYRPMVVLASLGGICGLTPEYKRVVEAELAEEALPRLENGEGQIKRRSA